MVTPLDYRTLFLASAIVGAALICFFAMETRRPYPGFLKIVFAIDLLSAAIVTADLMGFVSDALWSVQVIALCAFALIDSGIRSFCATSPRSSWPLIYVLTAVFLLTALLLARQPLYQRIIVNSLLLIPIFVDAALPLLRNLPEGRKFSHCFTAVVLMVGCLASGVRIVGIRSSHGDYPYFSPTRANTVFFVLVMFLLLGLGFGIIALTHERLMAELSALHEQFVAESMEKAHVERQLLRAERLASVGRLAAGVAHFFNNEMCAVQLACSLLRRDLNPSGTPVIGLLDDIDGVIRRGANITQRLLQYAQAKVLRPSQFNPLRLLEELLPALRAAAGEAVEVTTSHSPPIPLVALDVDLLKEAVFVTVQNACDAMPTGGRLSISLRLEEVDTRRAESLNLAPGSFVLLSIADTGSGMEDQVIRRVFEPFFTTKGLAKGEGLALASAYGFLRQSGGTITVCSTPQCGSTFELYLPKALAT